MRREWIAIWVALMLGLSGCDSKEEKAKERFPTTLSEVKEAGMITIEKGKAPEGENPFITYNIDGERQVKVGFGEDDNETTKSIGAIASVKTPYDRINIELLKGRLSKNFILKCSACHDDYANGIIGPSLLKKSEAEVFDKIIAYKTKKEANVLMKELVMQMDETEIRSLAKEISEFNQQFRSQP